MSTVSYDISMSVDGYVRGLDPTPDEPLGVGGEALHTWAMGDDPGGGEELRGAIAAMGALICGRRTYDDSIRWWGADGPTGSARLPLVVVTHTVPADVPAGSVYTFVTTGIEDALAQARTAAAGKAVSIMGGATVASQYVRAGLVDEVSIHVAPVLLGGGLRLTDVLPAPVTLELAGEVPTASAVHLRYRVVEPAAPA